MKFLKISKFLLVLILPFILFLLLVNFYGFSNLFYREKFLEYKAQQDAPEAIYLHEKVINFIKGKNSNLPNEFNEREKQHLWDVRNLVSMSTILLYILIISFILLLIISALILKVNNYITNFVGKVLIFGGFLTIALAAVLYLFISSNFSATFNSFHKLLFDKGTYVFDPAKDLIVNMYPEELFMELGTRISKGVVIASAVFILFGSLLLFKSKNKRKK